MGVKMEQTQTDKDFWHEVMKNGKDCPNLFAILGKKNVWKNNPSGVFEQNPNGKMTNKFLRRFYPRFADYSFEKQGWC